MSESSGVILLVVNASVVGFAFSLIVFIVHIAEEFVELLLIDDDLALIRVVVSSQGKSRFYIRIFDFFYFRSGEQIDHVLLLVVFHAEAIAIVTAKFAQFQWKVLRAGGVEDCLGKGCNVGMGLNLFRDDVSGEIMIAQVFRIAPGIGLSY